MTETSPIGTCGAPPDELGRAERRGAGRIYRRQGRVPFGVELRVVDDEGNVQPRDGKSSGRLQCRGPWVVKRYFKADRGRDGRGAMVRHGRRGLHPSRRHDADHRPLQGRDQVGRRVDQLDRAGKCRCRARRGRRSGRDRHSASRCGTNGRCSASSAPRAATSRADEIISHLRKHVASWWLPNAIEFVDELPHTATGKLSKLRLREQFKDYRFANAEEMVGRD